MPTDGDMLADLGVSETVEYVCSRGYRVVCLQFPDELLHRAAPVAMAVTVGCRRRGHDAQVRQVGLQGTHGVQHVSLGVALIYGCCRPTSWQTQHTTA